MITQSELKEILHYNPETGIFLRAKSMRGRGLKGDVAGVLSIQGYLRTQIKRKQYYMHRLAWLYMTGEWPEQIDHINHIKTDNRWLNLRKANNQENQRNKPMQENNTSEVVGVCWHKARNKWQAQIVVNDRNIYLGIFIDKFEAICARLPANNKYGFHPNHGK